MTGPAYRQPMDDPGPSAAAKVARSLTWFIEYAQRVRAGEPPSDDGPGLEDGGFAFKMEVDPNTRAATIEIPELSQLLAVFISTAGLLVEDLSEETGEPPAEIIARVCAELPGDPHLRLLPPISVHQIGSPAED